MRRPVVVSTADGAEAIAIHPVGNLAMSWDHRAFDGAYAAGGGLWAVGDGDGPYFKSASDPAGIKIGGSFPQNSEERNPCNCRMDDLMFFDRIVTPAEIAMQYARMLGH